MILYKKDLQKEASKFDVEFTYELINGKYDSMDKKSVNISFIIFGESFPINFSNYVVTSSYNYVLANHLFLFYNIILNIGVFLKENEN